MRLAFAGTPGFAATVLGGLLASPHEVGFVISQPDRPRGRGRKLLKNPVAALAEEAALPLRQPARIGEVAGEIADCDALVVAAYGQILRADTLYAARRDAWNVHASLLPAYRGAAPIERAIMNGETETGITIMKMDEGLDTGPIALQRPTDIPPEMTGGELTERLARLAAEAAVEAMSKLEAETLTLSQQDSLYATYAAKLEDEERRIRWERGVEEVHNLVRALSPRVGARAYHPDFDGPIKLLRCRIFSAYGREDPGNILPAKGRILVSCGEGVLEVTELQAPGGRASAAEEFLRGRALAGSFSA